MTRLGGPPPSAYDVSHISSPTIEGTFNAEENNYNRVVSRALRSYHKGQLNHIDESLEWSDVELAHLHNVESKCRVVGLAIETRPDEINPKEIESLRRLGATKIQLGVQSLNDDVLRINERGHTSQMARDAAAALRSAGFKLHFHWMANLLGSNPQEDRADFERLFRDPAMRPDELKLYPCSLIPNTPLMDYYERGDWRPYSREELLDLLCEIMPITPEYCRLTRVIRDIPSTDIHVGN